MSDDALLEPPVSFASIGSRLKYDKIVLKKDHTCGSTCRFFVFFCFLGLKIIIGFLKVFFYIYKKKQEKKERKKEKYI